MSLTRTHRVVVAACFMTVVVLLDLRDAVGIPASFDEGFMMFASALVLATMAAIVFPGNARVAAAGANGRGPRRTRPLIARHWCAWGAA